MRTVRFRVTGPDDSVQALLKRVDAIEEIDRVEEVADNGTHVREDSSSLDLPDDTAHSDFHDIEVHALSDAVARLVMREVELAAREYGLVAEFVDEF
ncbi:hypothetical protein [Dokdonella sp.]|uniref:hypothetical protein n=1 Tax=Dokdonella sp. TaxID=2291710 RepID=UPI002F3F874C